MPTFRKTFCFCVQGRSLAVGYAVWLRKEAAEQFVNLDTLHSVRLTWDES